MPKFRKRPVVIEAEQFVIGQPLPKSVNFGHPDPYHKLAGKYWIRSLEGDHVITDGYWVITGVKGEKYGCAPDIFEATYEPVLDEVTV